MLKLVDLLLRVALTIWDESEIPKVREVLNLGYSVGSSTKVSKVSTKDEKL